ncbi:MAG TPA: phosphate ABC transporter substrate-binding/OmpA family protein [Pirellulales bacterium]|jgi:outer membrane protein OmpA-like peptidoglycan-associated protein/ABC-type nitrate/sulfonate/bicarbonate transport system substrate-binding protein|nr:phosphate ABC transporter substrate-binding/OmpA family protein [Pirellulales bacterium]
MAGQPKAPFYIALFLVVGGLVALAAYKADLIAPKAPVAGGKGDEPIQLPQHVEEPSSEGITTVKEYKFKPAERLPDVKGISGYKLEHNTVRFALNVWAGWGPIILANEGFKAGKTWKAADGSEFKVDLVLIDNPVAMRDAYATGDIQIGWGTLDMIPLFMQGFVDDAGKPRDSRIMPRIYQQVDWSNGGDGIVVREGIKTVADLRGKQLVLSANSPSHYFALNMLVSGGVQPSEVNMIFTEDAFQAAAAFNARKDISGVVSWSPDIYNLEKVKGNRMLVNTQTANKLIADVWFARADFSKDHPEIIDALVRGIFDGMADLKDQKKKQHCAELMATGYNIPASDTINMFNDAHNTNWAENYQFFLNQNNPTNFERVWNQAYYLYRRIGSITHQPVPFDQVMDFSMIEKLGQDKKYSSQKDEYRIQLAPKTVKEITAEQDEILTNTIIIHFYPNSWDLHKMVTKTQDGKTIDELYDPQVDAVLEDIAKMVGQFGAAHVIIEGHTDSSMRGRVPDTLVKELSQNRANAVKEALVSKYKLDPNQFTAVGMGWDVPADPNDPDNHARNRRVEIKVYSAEKG